MTNPTASALSDLFAPICCCSYDLIDAASLERYLDALLAPAVLPHESEEYSSDTHPHALALLFEVLALGVLYAPIGSPSFPTSAATFHDIATRALSMTNYLSHPTLACVQTLVSGPYQITAHRS